MTIAQIQAVDVLQARLVRTGITPAEIEELLQLILALAPLFAASNPTQAIEPKA